MIYDKIEHKKYIHKGWSSDRKFQVILDNGSEYLLRESLPETYEQKRQEFEYMRLAFDLGVPMCEPIEFGFCESKVYSVYSWICGQDLRDILMNLTPDKQFGYGLEAGRILRTIHAIPAPANLSNWEDRFNKKIDRKIQMYEECKLKYADNGCIVEYITKNRHLLKGRPQSYQHGDYHDGNMMIDQFGNLRIIDFNRYDFGDPWEEFNRIVWSAQASASFATGMVDGYFGDHIPSEFWKLLCLYICTNALGSLPWAIPYGAEEIAVIREQTARVLAWYDHMTLDIPNWYHQDKV